MRAIEAAKLAQVSTLARSDREAMALADYFDVNVPANTAYAIDKTVRLRGKEGMFGQDFSAYVGLEKSEA